VEERLDTDRPDVAKEDSWIWQTGPAGKGKMSEKEVAEWYEKCACFSIQTFCPLICNSGDSVQWHRARALVKRWDEDVEALEEEFRRNIRSFEKMSEIWSELGLGFQPSGHRAYALEKSSAYARMAKESRKLFDAAGGSWPEEGESLFDLIRRLRKQRPRFEPLCCYFIYIS
jgi:hypothetical protein